MLGFSSGIEYGLDQNINKKKQKSFVRWILLKTIGCICQGLLKLVGGK